MTIVVTFSSANTDTAPDTVTRRLVTRFESIVVDVIHIERDGSMAIPYVWMEGAPCDAVEAELTADSDIAIAERIERTGDGAFYKLAWTIDSPLVQCVNDADGIILEARGTPERWRLQVWFEDRASASEFQACCRECGVPLTIDRLTSVAEHFERKTVRLSAPQRETLALAHEHGYFDEPRGTTQDELASKLGISASAVGKRLRRGLDSLVDEAVVE
ncbi:helix-turn-helix domain-containing protein [Halovivax cerinus]|uniref:Helix-turn-helix domain-containing protein n=1 Tax=Halovivax cerinus TaxID=1487865 RepID=A0ABD5NS63_9EURY|nr:helix-turn-helix domain-containing protein [Halovivax cerinus]